MSFGENLCRFPATFLGITIPESKLSNQFSDIIDLVVLYQRADIFCHIFGTVLSQKFGLLSPHQQRLTMVAIFLLSPQLLR